MPNNNDNYEYMKFLDLSGAQQIWNTCKQTFVQTVNGVGIDANGNCQVSGADALSIYPVGSIYMSVNNTSPASLFGGTWTQIKDVFLLGAGDTYTAGATGGEATHTLIASELPAHQHNVKTAVYNNGWGGNSETWLNQWLNYYWNLGTITSGGSFEYNGRTSLSGIEFAHTGFGDSVGTTGQAHNNMPPYLTVYFWKRTA